MKYIRAIGLLSVAAVVLMAFGSSASATGLKSSTGATPTIEASSTHLAWHGSFASVTCTSSTFSGIVKNHGPAVTAESMLSSWTFTGCNWPFTVIKAGTLAFHGDVTTGSGTITATGTEIQVHSSIGTCILKTAGTHLGTLTGSNVTRGHAVLDINSAKIPQESGNFFCGSSSTLTGRYTFTHPSALEVH